MADFATARRMMVDGQVRTADVTDLRIIAAMLDVPRERFVPPAQTGARLSRSRRAGRRAAIRRAPAAQADGARQADAGAEHRGDATACSMSAAPPAIRRPCWRGSPARWSRSRRMPALAGMRAASPAALGITNVAVVRGPLTAGWPQGAPYDAILVEGAIEVVPRRFAAAIGRWRPAGLHSRAQARPRKAMLYRLIEGERQRTADFRCRRARCCRASPSRRPSFSDATAPACPVGQAVARKPQCPVLFSGHEGRGCSKP